MTKNKRHMNRPFKTIRHLLLLLATAAAALCPGEAWADQVMYIEPNEYVTTVSATKITSATTSISTNENYDVYYFVEGDVTIDNLTITGSRNNDNVFIILCDDATLRINGQINCSCHLRFCAQSTGSHRGKVIATSAADDAIYGYHVFIEGGDVIVKNGGIKGDDISLHHGHLTADRLIANSTIDINAHNHSFSFKANEYITPLLFVVGFSIMADGETQIAKGGYHGNAGDSYSAYSAFKGKTLTVDPANLYNVTIDPTITGGTVTTNKAQAVANEYVYVTFTPATGYMLTSASRTPEGGTTKYADATELATAQSTGKWAFSQNSKSNVTVSATFAPIVASITSEGGTTTYYLTLADAFAAVPIDLSTPTTIVIQRDGIDESAVTYDFNDEFKAITIDLNGKTAKIGKIENKFGSLTITDSSTGHTGKAEFTWVENEGDVTIDGANVSMGTLDNPAWNPFTLLLKKGATLTTDFVEWDSKTVSLENGSHWTAKGLLDLGYVDGVDFIINDRNSWVQLVDCSLYSIYAADHLRALLTPLAPTGTTFNINDAMKNNFVLRKTWSLDLANSIPTYTSGESTYPKAVVQFYDGGTTDPTASFDPSGYHPTGEAGANEITTINNSDGADHYIIMHVAPTPNGGYWTDERLLYVMEGASAGARSRGPGISLNLPELLKRDLNDPSDPSQGYRYDGAGWYYYKLPASHCVANGYTKSTLFVEATRWFDLNDTDDSVDGDKVVQDGKKITVPNHEGWTAEILLDEVIFEFDGTEKKPVITKITFNNGSGTLFTLTDGFDNLLKVNGTKHIGRFPRKDECMIECVGTGWFTGTTPTATETTPAPVSYLVTVPLPVDDTSAERGTETNPWLVSTIAQMTLFGQCVDVGAYDFDGKYVRLAADLEYDATATNNYTPIGSGTPFAGTFFGTTDTGTPHVISGIRYDGTPALDKVGLFSQLGKNGGTGAVKDLQLKDCKFNGTSANLSGFSGGVLAGSVMGTQISNVTVTSSKIYGAGNVGAVTSVGGLAGNISQASTVSGCTVNGETYVNSQVGNDLGNEEAYCQVGGIAGYAHGSEISGCTVDDCSIYSFHSGDNCPGNEVGGIVGSAPYGVKLLNNRVTGDTGFFDNIACNNYSQIGAIYGNNGDGGFGDAGGAIFKKNYYDISVIISYMNGSTSGIETILGYMPRGTRVRTYDSSEPPAVTGAEFCDVTYGTVSYENDDPSNPINGTNDAAKMYVKPATISLTAGTGRSLVFTETTTPDLADDTHPADCYAIDGSTYYYAPGEVILLTATYQQRTDGVRTFYDEVTINAKDGSAAHADVTVGLNGNPSPSGSATPSGVSTYTRDFYFDMPADGVDVTADISESQWFTINTVNYNADDPSQPNAYNWMTFYHEWTDGTGTAATPANYKVTNYDNPLLDVEVMTVSRVNSADGTFALADIDSRVCFHGMPTIFHYADNSNGVLPQKLKFTPVDPNDPQTPAGGYAEPTVAKQFQGTVSDKTLTADDKCYVLNNAGDFILAYPTDGDDKIAAHKSYIDLSIEDNGNTQAPARLVSVGDETGIGRLAIDGSSDGASDGPWYSLDGRRLNGQPTRKGIYIYKGKKTVIK